MPSISLSVITFSEIVLLLLNPKIIPQLLFSTLFPAIVILHYYGEINIKAKSKIIILIALGILFVLLPMITVNTNFITGNSNKREEYNDDINLDDKNLKISAVSGKIHIDNNWSAAEAAGICTGAGTYSEPYVIEDLVIDGEGSGSCILIENSDVYFIITNCIVNNS
ncbi:unnamed protein product, partial [marine sediment metagenome]